VCFDVSWAVRAGRGISGEPCHITIVTVATDPGA
jgi:hypothetical protein